MINIHYLSKTKIEGMNEQEAHTLYVFFVGCGCGF
jgi:hypothetical protein